MNGDDIATTAQFNIVVVNVHSVVLDENATTAPEAATNVNVLVKRTIKANEWSTICLPFAMDATQVKAAFGDDVQLGDFNGAESTTEGDDVTAITAKFNAATAIEANHPYIIKVSSAVSQFAVDGVDITPSDELSIDKDEKTVKVGKNTYTYYNSFVGTYVAQTIVPELTLFLNGNKFYYSNGSTKMKAFRAYFDFYDVLKGYDSDAPVYISFENETTDISKINLGLAEDSYYDLQGRRVNTPSKGLYIINGKKVVKK